ncbi:hypothetical protein DFH07DRAFT_771734 [Mycena maculata]|uniref:Uncharacterized protein n=1 Tax=Mycena maculata TaxID=230809 RepID=A0AAD7NH74_9AGAR|nr:hypothetical protein DFH07DRAFT_771734 [Mycena maculata]
MFWITHGTCHLRMYGALFSLIPPPSPLKCHPDASKGPSRCRLACKHASSRHTPANQAFLDGLSSQLMDFWNYVYSPTYIAQNAEKFLNTEWAGDIKMRTSTEGGWEILELLSDSEPNTADPDSDFDEVVEVLQPTSRSSSAAPIPSDYDDSELTGPDSGEPSGVVPGNLPDLNENDISSDHEVSPDIANDMEPSKLVESDTVWLDGGKSWVRIGQFHPTHPRPHMEYRDSPASVYPVIPHTGFVVDLSHPKYMLRDPNTKELYMLTIIRNVDNNLWDTGSGGAKATAMVTFGQGETPVKCRRARSCCKGCHACERIEPALQTAVHFKLDPAALSMVLAAQVEARQREGNTPEENVATFMKIIHDSKCAAADSRGNKCQDSPGTSNGHQYFIACRGWTLKFKENHRTLTIPNHVNENLLAKAMAGQPLTDDPDKNTPPCRSDPSIAHAHIVNGVQVQSRILNDPCSTRRSIYVPIDSPIRKVLIVHNETGHNHPVLPLTKVTFELKDTWRECIEENGVLRATVSKIDNVQSTIIILGGKTPAVYAPALQNTRAPY